MGNKIKTLVAILLITTTGLFAQKKERKPINETYEWSHTWIVNSTEGNNLPSVLLIGDSHVERYHPVVSSDVKDKYRVSKITTSKSMGDPRFISHIEGMLGNDIFDVIYFNNGLHGAAYSIEDYANDLPSIYKLLKKHLTSTGKIHWVTSTAMREPNNLDAYGQRNNQIIQRNEKVIEFCSKNNIKVIDFSQLSADKSNYSDDGVHFNEKGVNAQTKMIERNL